LAAGKDEAYLSSLDLLVRLCPGERDAASYLRWVASLSVGELYALIAQQRSPTGPPIPPDLPDQRDQYVAVLTAWNEQYFCTVDSAILDGLAAEAAALRARVPGSDPAQLVEQTTCGVQVEPAPGLEQVLLVPQHHFRPWNLYGQARGVLIYHYPADVLTQGPHDIPSGLLRLTQALSDPNRLRILRLLSGGPRSFTDVVRFSRLAKSTVHHHMVALRAAGLIRVHGVGTSGGADRYALRPDALGELSDRLGSYLKGEA